MKLKLIVASMGLLGLISCQTFAATDDANTSTTKTKHHHHHKMKKHHHHMKHEARKQEMREEMRAVVAHPDFKGEVCTVSQTAIILDESTQNLGRSLPNPCNPGWFNRIAFSGGINVDLGKWGNRNANYMGENYQRLSINDAYLNFTANVNDWTKAFASISLNTATSNDPSTAAGISTPQHHVAEYDEAYTGNMTGGTGGALQLEQGYVTFSNFDVTPLYVQIGKQFQDFGRYQIHPITESLTEVMSKTLTTSAKLGFIVPMGLHGSVSVFDDPISKIGQTKKPTDFTVALGYDQPNDQLGWGVGIGYIYNLIGVNDIAFQVAQFNANNASNTDAGFTHHASGVALYGDVNSGPFALSATWTTATQRFSVFDLPEHGVADVMSNGLPMASAAGAKPWTAGIQGGYGFEYWGKSQNIYLGYQASGEAAGLLLPKNRWLAGYDIEVWRDTNLGFEWDHDTSYSVGNGGTGNNSNLASLRASVQFG